MSPDNNNKFIEGLFLNLSEKVDSHYLETQKKLDNLQESVNDRVDVLNSKVEEHDRNFKLIGRVLSWGGGTVGLGTILTFITEYFNHQK